MQSLSIVVPRIVLSWMWRFSCAPHLLTTIRFSQSCIYTFEKTNCCNYLTSAHTITHCQLDPTSFADWFFISCHCLFWNHVLWQRGDLPANPSHAKKWEGRINKSVGFSCSNSREDWWKYLALLVSKKDNNIQFWTWSSWGVIVSVSRGLTWRQFEPMAGRRLGAGGASSACLCQATGALF